MATVSGGAKLNDALKSMGEKLRSAKSVQVGFLPDATYPSGGINVATVAAIQEYGAPSVGIPPRPFFRSMIDKNKPSWPALIASQLNATKFDAAKTLDRVGQEVAGELRQSITDTNAPPLSPVTLMLRMMKKQNPDLRVTGRTVAEARKRVAAGESASGVSTKALVDTGNLLASVDYVVK